MKKNKAKEKNEQLNSKLIIADEAKKIKRKKIIKKILIILSIIFAILIIMFCVSLYKWNKIMKNIINCKNSVIVDSVGNVITTIGSSRIQENVELSKVPQNLINAYISIEDKNFYKHHGINVKRTTAATFSYIFNKKNASFGGSTITQQLVKNVTGENETTVGRKMKEWDRAFKTECVLSKDEIMETYLNII